MLFLGKVVSTKNFGSTGTIEVLLPQKYFVNGAEGTLAKRLWEVETNKVGEILSSDSWSRGQKLTVECNVVTPFGNGYNTGFFQLPQVNTIGLVLQTQDYNTWANTNYIWIGGIYGSKLYGEPIIIPRDDTVTEDFERVEDDVPLISKESREAKEDTEEESETYYGELGDYITGDLGYFNDGQIILKTKTSKSNPIIEDKVIKKEGIDFKDIPVENTIVVSKEKIALRHDTNEQTIKTAIADIFLEDGKIRIKRNTADPGSIKKDENGKVVNDNKLALANTQSIEISSDNITISFDNKKGKDENGNDKEQINKIVLNADGTIVIDATSDITVRTDGNMNFNSEKEMNLVSKGKMSFIANNQNLKEILDHFIDDVKNIITIGSPDTQVVNEASQATFDIVKDNELNQGYK